MFIHLGARIEADAAVIAGLAGLGIQLSVQDPATSARTPGRCRNECNPRKPTPATSKASCRSEPVNLLGWFCQLSHSRESNRSGRLQADDAPAVVHCEIRANSWRNCVASRLLAMAMLVKEVAGQFTGA